MITFLLCCVCVRACERTRRLSASLRTQGAAGCAQVVPIQDQRSLGIQEIVLSPN